MDLEQTDLRFAPLLAFLHILLQGGFFMLLLLLAATGAVYYIIYRLSRRSAYYILCITDPDEQTLESKIMDGLLKGYDTIYIFGSPSEQAQHMIRIYGRRYAGIQVERA